VGIPEEGLALLREPDRGLRAAVAKGDDADRTSTEAWLMAWLTELAPARRSANTIANYRWAFEKWVIPNVGKIPLADLGPGDLERVWRLMEAKGHSANSIRAARAAVSAALSGARRRGWWIATPPSSPRSPTPPPRPRPVGAVPNGRFRASPPRRPTSSLRRRRNLHIPMRR